MWKKEDAKPQGIPERPSSPVNAPTFGSAPCHIRLSWPAASVRAHVISRGCQHRPGHSD